MPVVNLSRGGASNTEISLQPLNTLSKFERPLLIFGFTVDYRIPYFNSMGNLHSMYGLLDSDFVYENKTIFIYFLAISGIIHLIFIFSTSSISDFLKPDLNFSDYGTKDSDYIVEIDLGTEEQKEENVENEELIAEELPEEEELIESDVREEKRPLFVDTSGRTIDEETQVESNKIGEKGSIARDMYADENNVNDNSNKIFIVILCLLAY